MEKQLREKNGEQRIPVDQGRSPFIGIQKWYCGFCGEDKPCSVFELRRFPPPSRGGPIMEVPEGPIVKLCGECLATMARLAP